MAAEVVDDVAPTASSPPAPPARLVKVKTTLPSQPVPPNSERRPIETKRLVLKPLEQSDLEGVHILRTQPEVMVYTSVGRCDRDRAETQIHMDRFLPPNDVRNLTYNFVAHERLGYGDGTKEKKDLFVGKGGVHKLGLWFRWPEVGYMLRKEFWGRGLATEFLSAWIVAWWKLPRTEVEIEVDKASVAGLSSAQPGRESRQGEGGQSLAVPEQLTAMIEENNLASRRVIEKLGFREFTRWVEPDNREGYNSNDITLVGYALSRPAS